MHSILIVEDDEDYSEVLKLGLSNSGHQVTVASSARMGLSLTVKNTFSLIICDVLMPEMDGFEFLIEIKKSDVTAKIIMISGGGLTNDRLYLDNSTALGCDAVLEKPFTIIELEKLIKSIF